MNTQAIRILFLKDLFLCRKFMAGYLVAGLACSILASVQNETIAFTGSILVMTVAITSGIHFICTLLLAETTDHTRLFVMSLPVSLLEYSLSKIAVVLTTYLIPWFSMLACATIFTFVLPGSKHGAVAIIPVIFLYLLGGFTIQLVTAVVTQSVGCTICVMVGCNVFLNVFLRTLYSNPQISQAAKSDVVTWPPLVLQLLAIELAVIAGAIALSFFFQTRKRDLV